MEVTILRKAAVGKSLFEFSSDRWSGEVTRGGIFLFFIRTVRLKDHTTGSTYLLAEYNIFFCRWLMYCIDDTGDKLLDFYFPFRFLFRGQGLHYKLNGDSYLGKYHSDFFYSTMLNGKQVGLMKSDNKIVMGKFKSVLKYSKKLVGKEQLLFLFSLLTLDRDRNQIGEYSLAQTSYSKILFDKHKDNVQWIPD